jgi:class 3 adenylate cyclase
VSAQTATILVTDLVASTELRARLGEEQADRLRRLHDRLLRTSVETHGGVVVKGLGHEAAAATIETCGAARARALNGYQWAVTLLARDAPGDRRRARCWRRLWPTAGPRATRPS